MQKYLIILILYCTGSIANNDIVSQEKQKEKLKSELRIILKDLQNYKAKNEKEIQILKFELNRKKNEFQNYKKNQQKLKKLLNQKKRRQVSRKNNQYLKLKKQLIETEKKLQKNTKRYQKVKKNNQFLKKKIAHIKKKKKETIIISPQKKEKIKMNVNTPIPLPIKNDLPWVEIIVEDNTNIYELALRYYGDSSKYKEIYSANKNIIGKNLKIYNGMSLKIPMTIEFDEQPIILNTH